MGANGTKLKKRKFLESYATTGNVCQTCRETGLPRRTIHSWLRRDKAFRAAYDTAQEEAVEALEAEARRRAEKGTLEPVYHQGQAVGAIRKYSDTLLIFLLKGAKPEKYRDRYEVTGAKGGPIQVQDVPLTKDQLRAELTKRGWPTELLTKL